MKQKILAYLGAVCLSLAPLSSVTAEVTVSAQSAVLYQPTSGRILYQKNADTVRAMASTTKLMTALILAESKPADERICISEKAVPAEGSSMGLQAGDTLTVRALLMGMLLASGNDAANAAALAVSDSLEAFAVLMNRRAAALGMQNTVFVTPSGLDQGDHGSTAYDMALLGAAVMQNSLLREICATQSASVAVSDRTVWLSNHNKLLSLYPYAVGLKTGFTKKAGRCLVSAAEKDGVLLIAVTLSAPDDWNDHIQMHQYGFAQTQTVQCPPQRFTDCPLIGGVASSVSLSAQTPPPTVVLKGETVRVVRQVPPFLFAPIYQGQQVGTVQYFVGEKQIAQVPVVVDGSVASRPAKGFLRRVGEMWLALLGDLMTI